MAFPIWLAALLGVILEFLPDGNKWLIEIVCYKYMDLPWTPVVTARHINKDVWEYLVSLGLVANICLINAFIKAGNVHMVDELSRFLDFSTELKNPWHTYNVNPQNIKQDLDPQKLYCSMMPHCVVYTKSAAMYDYFVSHGSKVPQEFIMYVIYIGNVELMSYLFSIKAVDLGRSGYNMMSLCSSINMRIDGTVDNFIEMMDLLILHGKIVPECSYKYAKILIHMMSKHNMRPSTSIWCDAIYKRHVDIVEYYIAHRYPMERIDFGPIKAPEHIKWVKSIMNRVFGDPQ